MRPVAENLIDATKAAFLEIEGKFSEIPPQTSSALREAGVEITEGSEDIYEIVANEIAHDRRPPGQRRARDLSLIVNPNVTRDIVHQRQDARIAQEKLLSGELRTLTGEVALLDEELSAFKKPEGIKSAIVVLIYLTLVGMVLPTI